MYCVNCGKEIGNVKFCPYCGAKNENYNNDESQEIGKMDVILEKDNPVNDKKDDNGDTADNTKINNNEKQSEKNTEEKTETVSTKRPFAIIALACGIISCFIPLFRFSKIAFGIMAIVFAYIHGKTDDKTESSMAIIAFILGIANCIFAIIPVTFLCLWPAQLLTLFL